MIDSDLRMPYLIRNYLNRIVGYNEEARNTIDIKNYYEMKKNVTKDDKEISQETAMVAPEEVKGVLADIEDDYYKEINVLERKTQKKQNIYTYDSYLEIDFLVFEDKFWSQIFKKKKYTSLSPNLVWTQIYSVIKGSMDHWLTEQEYYRMEKNLTDRQKKEIYAIYCDYEIFKRRIGAFDLMDLVLHIFRSMDYVKKKKKLKIRK